MKIDFEKTDDVYTYKDAIELPDDHQYTFEELEIIKEQRFYNWLQSVKPVYTEITDAPPPPPISIDEQ